MPIKAHSLVVPKTAHFYTLGEPGEQTKYLWIACHGYGQLASKFLEKFNVISNEENFIVAPEGFSRFYWGGFEGPVVSSWMTRKDRLDEIADYATFLTTIYNHFKSQLPLNVKVILFGFSQGVATIMRWLTRHCPDFNHLVLWAGILPEDIDYLPLKNYFSGRNLIFAYGHQDQYLTPDRIKMYKEIIQKGELKIREEPFYGGHTIDPEKLYRLNEFLVGIDQED